jgi:acetyl-CoA acetyltransferase
MARNPIKDKVAIVGLGSTGYVRDSSGSTQAALALRACRDAIRDAGVAKSEVDGVVGTAPPAPYVVSGLGLHDVTYYTTEITPFASAVIQAANAVFAGSCEVAVAYHAVYRTPATSRSAAKDPFRRMRAGGGALRRDPELVDGGVAYTAWASRYLYETKAEREDLGYIAVNDRTNAERNPLAVMREPLTLTDYANARMIREPLSLLDMDVPVDGADAVVITTAERARHLRHKPVYLHATALGITSPGCWFGHEDQGGGLDHHGQQVVISELRGKSDFWLDAVDVYYPYDGFSFITLSWLENAGWCKRGEAGDFLRQHWDTAGNRILIDGRIPVNTHGGGLSEGATQGSGHIREAVSQLRGTAGERQVDGARTALVTPGGFFFNSQGLVLRS